MDYDDIFEAYYNLYRLEADTPAAEDDEYVIGIRLANEAINKWENYDGTYWIQLFTTLGEADDGDKVLSTATEYACPTDMREPGGYLQLIDATGVTVRRIPIITPEQAQFRNDASVYCYFTGNPNTGFTLHINPLPTTAAIGLTMDYVYYKKGDKMEDGSSKPDMADPYFMVHRMLANRFRGSRNPYYTTAKNEAENALRIMQADNNSGTWANPWQLPDNSGTTWGA